MSLFASLSAASNTLDAFNRSLAVVQNNVTNASTAGYVRQRMPLLPRPFDPTLGVAGGVSTGELESSRRDYTESAVRRQNSLAGRFDELATSLSRLEGTFDATGTQGIPRALTRLFDSFSALAVAPSDPLARQFVLDRAGDLVREVNAADAGLARAQQEAVAQSGRLADRINELGDRLRSFNAEIRRDRSVADDPGVDAEIHTTLESLSELVDIQTLRAADGTFTVLLGGQSGLVIGETAFPLRTEFDGTSVRIFDPTGADITDQVNSGRLRGALEAAGSVIPGWRSQLDQLAASVADTVNAGLVSGVDKNGVPGVPLFTYTTADDAAATLSMGNITPDQVAAAAATAPGGNANALDLAALAGGPQIDGLTFNGFYSRISAAVGEQLTGATHDREVSESLLVQARELRQQESGVSLDEEAARLLELQRAYQATARLFTVLDSLTETTINMLR
ncbi:MAG: flagellar hook-associated protein FlgK [Bryobacteraceae bacterium]